LTTGQGGHHHCVFLFLLFVSICETHHFITSKQINAIARNGRPMSNTKVRKFSTLGVFFALVLLSMPGLFLAPSAFSQKATTQATTANLGPMIVAATTSEESLNWGGYAATGSGFTAVSGSWTQPSVTCSSTGTRYVAIWIGMDGFSSKTVEQTGTAVQCANGKAIYWAWYEFYPKVSVAIGSILVNPGDTFTAKVTYSSATGKFTTTITDTTTGKTFSAHSAVTGAKRSSAEWIVERPLVCTSKGCSLATLANFHTMTFTSASATLGKTTGSISQFTNYAITMVTSSGTPLAKPSTLSSSGSSFTMTYV
jgi:hypothetical protein